MENKNEKELKELIREKEQVIEYLESKIESKVGGHLRSSYEEQLAKRVQELFICAADVNLQMPQLQRLLMHPVFFE